MLNSSKIKRMAFISMSVLIILYIIFQILYTKIVSIQTETAIKTSAHNEYETDGYIFRDEVLISNDSNGGVISYNIADGTTIAKGETIGDIYASKEDATAQTQVEKLQSELSSISQLQQGNTKEEVSLETINEQLYTQITQTLSSGCCESYLNSTETRTSILNLLNERHIIVGNPLDFTAKINELDSQIKQIKATHSPAVRSITSPEAGYFISYMTGYENSYDYNKIKQISPAEIEKGFTKQENKSNIIGKIDKSLVWYVVCNIPVSDVMDFSLGSYVDLSIPLVSNSTFNAKIEAINYDSSSSIGYAAVVFACNVMNSELSKTGYEKIVIKNSENTGIRVSKNSVHVNTLTRTVKDANGNKVQESKDVQGVYVLYGKQLIFKQIFPLCATDKYIICKQEPDPDELFTESTVQVYDKVVTKGTRLYDGKFVR